MGENKSLSQWGERGDESAGYLCHPETSGCHPQGQETHRWALGSGGILGIG